MATRQCEACCQYRLKKRLDGHGAVEASYQVRKQRWLYSSIFMLLWLPAFPSSEKCGDLSASLLMLLPLCCVNRILCCLRRDAQHVVGLSFLCCICHSQWILMQCHFCCSTVGVRRTPEVLRFSVSVVTISCLWNSSHYVVGLPQC